MIYLGALFDTQKRAVSLPPEKNLYNHKESKQGNGEQVHVSVRMSESPGIFFLMHPDGEVGQVASLRFSTGVSIPVEEEILVSENSDHNVNEDKSVVMDETTQPSESLSSRPHLVDHSYI